MKRNLFAIFLTVMLVSALIFVAAPSTRAEVVKLDADNDRLEVSVDTVIDLNGHNATVYLAEGTDAAILTVVDSANKAVDGAGAGKLFVNGNITFTKAPLFDGMRYLKVENQDGSFSFHPFNLTISQCGLNTIGTDGKGAICLRATFVANNVVRDLITASGDYGIYNTKTSATSSAKERYPFGSNNFIHTYCDVSGSLAEAVLDSTASYGAYITVNGETVYSSYSQIITTRTILEKIDKLYSSDPELFTEKRMGNFANVFAAQPYLYDCMPSIYNAIPATHKCESICGFCRKCTDTACTEYVCANKCAGHSITINSNSYTVTSDLVAIDENISKLGTQRFLIFTPAYTGTGITLSSGYGEAFVLDQYGKIVRIYDGANGKYYDAENTSGVQNGTCTAAGYLKEAFASRQDGEYLLIAPNDGVSINDQTTARRFLYNNRTIGAMVTLPGVDFAHFCENLCVYCNGCKDAECTDVICANKCSGHVVGSMLVTIGAKKYEAAPGMWARNETITTNTAANKAIWVFTKDYTGNFSTNGFGVAVVLDSDGKVARVYDGANGGYWLPSGKQASAHFTTSTFATVAWSELQVGETLVVFTNGPDGNKARQIGLDCRYLFGQKLSIITVDAE